MVGHLRHGLAEGHHRVGDADLSTTHEIILRSASSPKFSATFCTLRAMGSTKRRQYCPRLNARQEEVSQHAMWLAAHLQVLQADLKMELSGTGNNVLSSLLDLAHDHGVRLGQPLQT